MLNPESVDKQKDIDIVIINFTDGEGDDALDIILSEKDAIRLGNMILEQFDNKVNTKEIILGMQQDIKFGRTDIKAKDHRFALEILNNLEERIVKKEHYKLCPNCNVEMKYVHLGWECLSCGNTIEE